jgi:MarR family
MRSSGSPPISTARGDGRPVEASSACSRWSPVTRGSRPAGAERLHVDSSLAARRVRVCEDAGFVKVSPDPADRRSVLVAITPAGSEELRRLERPSLERIEMLVADWEPDQVRTLTGLLANLGTSVATLAARERRSRRRRFASDAGLPDWFVQWLGG